MRKPSELVSGMGSGFEILKTLVEATVNHGGSDRHVRRILQDPSVAASIAKRLVGPIWDLVDRPIPLDVDWDSPLQDFIKNFDGPGAIDNLAFLMRDVVDEAAEVTRPTSPCQYSLVHFEKPISEGDVLTRYQPAGFRELCTYLVARPKHPEASIIALGSSREYQTDTGSYRVFTQAEVQSGPNRPPRKVYRIHNQSQFDPSFFFLVRIPA